MNRVFPAAHPTPIPQVPGKSDYEKLIESVKGELLAAGKQMIKDGPLRVEYERRIIEGAKEITMKAQSGKINWLKAADEAVSMRNKNLGVIRGESSSLGKALAQFLKKEGKDLNSLIAKKMGEMFKGEVDFWALSLQQRERVYRAVVASSGKANPEIMAYMRLASKAGKTLLFFSLAVSVYNVASAENKQQAALKEGAGLAAGFAGAAAGSVLGLACGPGAFVCVPLFGFVGGAAAAWKVDESM